MWDLIVLIPDHCLLFALLKVVIITDLGQRQKSA